MAGIIASAESKYFSGKQTFMKPYIDQTPEERKNSLKIVGLTLALNIPYLGWVSWAAGTNNLPARGWIVGVVFIANMVIGVTILKWYAKRLRAKQRR
jgi:hypothetical protein